MGSSVPLKEIWCHLKGERGWDETLKVTLGQNTVALSRKQRDSKQMQIPGIYRLHSAYKNAQSWSRLASTVWRGHRHVFYLGER